MPNLPRWSATKEPFISIADQMNRFVSAIRKSAITAVDGAELLNSIGGQSISVPKPAQYGFVEWMGIIVDEGPASQADYSDARYWVAPAYLSQTGASSSTDAAVPIREDSTDETFDQVTVTNIAELSGGTHSLQVGDTVRVCSMYGRSTGTSQIIQHVMWSNANGARLVIVKQNGTDGTNPLYDLFDLSDTGYTSPLNDEPLAPVCSRARWNGALVVTAPPDGSHAVAFYTDGGIELWDLPETDETNDCSMTDLLTF
jgi:hypothetical protein